MSSSDLPPATIKTSQNGTLAIPTTMLVSVINVCRVQSPTSRTLGRLEDLVTLETDPTKSDMLLAITKCVSAYGMALDQAIGRLEVYAALEVDPGQRMVVESIVRDLESMKGKW
jgi:hypothetical protein